MAKLDYYSFNSYICVLHEKNTYLPRCNCVSSGFKSERTRGKMAQSQGKQLHHDTIISWFQAYLSICCLFSELDIFLLIIFFVTILFVKLHLCHEGARHTSWIDESKCEIAAITEAALPLTIMFWHFYPISSNTNICVTTTLLKIRYYNTCNK